ncbi:MAG: PmoA family protein [Bacteroidales bacterium]|nr:PmoA family protein [Bacteroidales bacterium]
MQKIKSKIKISVLPFIFLFLIFGCGNTNSKTAESTEANNKDSKFMLVDNPAEEKVEVWIDSELFTSYMYPDNIAKPVLYPIRTVSGKVLTRSYPLESIPGERVDHPHHIGIWMNYGDVNGLDFWNNSEAISESKKDRYGSIFHKEVKNIENGDESGSMDVVCEWKAPDGTILLEENTKFVFTAEENSIIIDRITTLKALDKEVSLKDNKEGMIAIRVARALELPSEKPDIFLDAHGNPTETKVLDNTGVNGNYLSSEGVEGGEVWATRARWMKLHSTIDDEKVALVIFDHPDNVGYPTYWHARGYGLFAANPLGQEVFSKGENVLDFKLAANESVTFKYRVLVHSTTELSSEAINTMADDFSEK